MSDYASTGPLERLDYGRMAYHVVFLEPSVAASLPLDEHPRLRITGEVGEVPLDGAWIPSGDGRWYVILSKAKLKAGGWSLGDVVTVRFDIADQEAVEIPGELAAALSGDAEFREAWGNVPPGRQRGLCHHVRTAKRAETKAKRVAEVREAVLHDPTKLRPPKRAKK